MLFGHPVTVDILSADAVVEAQELLEYCMSRYRKTVEKTVVVESCKKLVTQLQLSQNCYFVQAVVAKIRLKALPQQCELFVRGNLQVSLCCECLNAISFLSNYVKQG